MAQVPQYGPAPTEALDPLRPQTQRTLASGETLGVDAKQTFVAGNAIQGTGGALVQVAARIQQRDNTDRVLRATSAFTDEYLAKEREWKEQRRGVDAKGLYDDSQKWFAETEKRYNEGLTNPLQQRAFAEQAARVRQASGAQLSNFESAETRRSLEEAQNSAIVSATNHAAANANNPAALVENHRIISDSIEATAALNHWTPERKQAELEKGISSMHVAVVAAQIDTNPRAAEAYYKANIEEINGTQRDEIEKTLRIGTLRETAQKATADIMSKHGDDETAALAYANENYKGEELDSIETRIKTRFNEKAAARAERYRRNSDAAWNNYLDSGYNLDAVPSSVLSGMDPIAEKALRDYADARVRGGVGVQTDFGRFSAQVDLYSNPDTQQDFANQDFNALRPYIGAREMGILEDLRNKVATGKIAAPETYGRNEQLNTIFGALGLTQEYNAQTRGQIQLLVNDRIASAQAAQPDPGKPLGDVREREIIDEVFTQLRMQNPALLTPQTKPLAANKYATATQQIASTLNGIASQWPEPKTPNDPKNKEFKAEYERVARAALRQTENEARRPLTEDEKQRVLDRLLERGSVSGTGTQIPGFGEVFEKSGFLFQFIEQADQFVPDEP